MMENRQCDDDVIKRKKINGAALRFMHMKTKQHTVNKNSFQTLKLNGAALGFGV